MVDRRPFPLYPAAVTLGSLFIAYGLREFLRATGGGYYCCNHLNYQITGGVVTFVGWTILFITIADFYREMTE